MKTTLVSWLLRLYPKAWRKEYGAELGDMLRARPLTARIVFDVARSAVWQQVRAVDASMYVGIGLMLVTLAAMAANIVEPLPYAWSPGQSLHNKPTLPEHLYLLQRPLHSGFYVLALAALGFWTVLRGRNGPGRAAIYASSLASIPLVIIGVLMFSGVLDYVELLPGQIPVSFDEGGIVYTFYKGQQQVPGSAPLVYVLSPLLRLPGAWLWGSIGGRLGRHFIGLRRLTA
jgi:hypothetical protein